MRVAYISLLERFTFKEVEVNSEYHAPRKYRFMVMFVFQTFCGVCMLSSLLFIKSISNMLHMNNFIFTQINFNLIFSRCLNYLANEFMFFPIYTYFLLEYNS